MHFGAKAVVSEAGQCVVDPVLTAIVVVEDAHTLRRRWSRFLWRNTRRRVRRSSVYGGTQGRHAQGVGVVGHVYGDVSSFDLTTIEPDFEGDIARGHVKPELLRYARSWLRVSGASCRRRTRSSSSARRLSSPSTSPYGAYLHGRLFGCGVVDPSFILSLNGFFVTPATSERGLTSTTYLVNSVQVMIVAEEDGQCVASAGAHGVPTSQADDFVSEAGAELSDELTRLPCSSGASLGAMAIFAPFRAAGAVREDRRRSSIRWRTICICSLLHSFVSFVHADLSDFCCVAQFDASSVGTVGRDSTRLWCGELGST